MGTSSKDDPGSATGAREKSGSWHVGVSPLGTGFAPCVLAHPVDEGSDDNFQPAMKNEATNRKNKKRNVCLAVGVPWVCVQRLHGVKPRFNTRSRFGYLYAACMKDKAAFLWVGISVWAAQMGIFQEFGIHLLTEIKNSIQNRLIVFPTGAF